jgi:RNA polymerase sigma-70 factor (ECF subfamily)
MTISRSPRVSITVEAVTDDSSPADLDRDAGSQTRDRWRELFAELAAGRMAALEELYDLAAADIYGLALWRTSSTEDASDVVQEVFMRVVEQGKRLAGVRNPRSWLLTVARRAAIDVVRKSRRRLEDPVEQHPYLTAGDASGRLLDAAHVSVLLAGLPSTQREVVYLKHFAGCTYSEIGRIVGVPTFTAASRHRAAVAALRDLLEDGA